MFDESPSFVRTAALWATFAAAGMSVAGCRSEAEIAQERAERVAVAQAKELAERVEHQRQVTELAQDARSLVVENAYVVTLKMAKSSISLDPFEHMSNEMKAQYRDLIVGEKEYNQRRVGQVVSSKADIVGFFSDGAAANYEVTVHRKTAIPHYLYVDSAGNSHEVSSSVFNEGKSLLAREGKSLYHTSASGKETWLVSDEPVSAEDIKHIAPLNRYYANVRIANSSVSFSLSKHLSNATTEHVVQVEIPEKVYLSKDDAFDARLSDSAIINGRLSTLSGKMEKKWSERDNESVLVTLKDGRQIPMKKSELPK